MTKRPQHLYNLRIESVTGRETAPVGSITAMSVVAESARAAEAVARNTVPFSHRVTLAEIRKVGDGCGDERCAICHPSRRNGGRL